MKLSLPEKVENVKCKPVPEDVDLIKSQITHETLSAMMNLMYEKGGLGLAAPQVGIRKRFFIAFMPEKGAMQLFLNPSYEPEEKAKEIDSEEGCLTYGQAKYKVRRYNEIKAKYLVFDEQGLRWQKEKLTDIDAIVFQHETDHCDGKTIAMLGTQIE